MNIGAVLILDDPADLDFTRVTSVLASRLSRIPRLRQRLVKTPPGCGRPIWVDHPGFDLNKHLSRTELPASSQPVAGPGTVSDEQVLEIAARMVCTPLSRQEPLWAARWVTGPARDRAALILVMHHTLTDGV